MRYLFIFIFSFGAFAQEGKAVRPVAKPDCQLTTTTQPALESCTFRQYRFTSEAGPSLRGFKVSRMESGNYIPTSLELIFKDKAHALRFFNNGLRKEHERRIKGGEPCPEFSEAQLTDLGIRFEGEKAVISFIGGGCGQFKVSLRELERLLK